MRIGLITFLTSTMGEQGLPITEEMFNSFKKYYLYWYDSKLEISKANTFS